MACGVRGVRGARVGVELPVGHPAGRRRRASCVLPACSGGQVRQEPPPPRCPGRRRAAWRRTDGSARGRGGSPRGARCDARVPGRARRADGARLPHHARPRGQRVLPRPMPDHGQRAHTRLPTRGHVRSTCAAVRRDPARPAGCHRLTREPVHRRQDSSGEPSQVRSRAQNDCLCCRRRRPQPHGGKLFATTVETTKSDRTGVGVVDNGDGGTLQGRGTLFQRPSVSPATSAKTSFTVRRAEATNSGFVSV